MEKQKNPNWKSAMTHGAMLGAALVIFSVLLYVFNVDVYNPNSSQRAISWLSYLILIVGLFIAQMNYRDTVLDGSISYTKLLGYGVLVGVFASIISTFYMIIFFKFIDPEVMQYIYDMSEQQMIDKGLSDADIDKAMEITKKITFPMMVIGGLIGYAFVSFIISLITSIIIKKEKDLFNSAMSEVNNESVDNVSNQNDEETKVD